MSNYTKANVREDVENQAPKFGMPDELDARFARSAIGGKTLGLSLMKLDPNFRIPFGHKHEHQEEVYVVVRGSGASRSRTKSWSFANGTPSASTRTRCGTWRQARTGSSSSPSGRATIRSTRKWCKAGGETDVALQRLKAFAQCCAGS